MKSPAMKWVGKIVWVLTALGAINIGLVPMGYNFLLSPTLAGVAVPLHYLIGVAGVVSLVMLVLKCTRKCESKSSC